MVLAVPSGISQTALFCVIAGGRMDGCLKGRVKVRNVELDGNVIARRIPTGPLSSGWTLVANALMRRGLGAIPDLFYRLIVVVCALSTPPCQ